MLELQKRIKTMDKLSLWAIMSGHTWDQVAKRIGLPKNTVFSNLAGKANPWPRNYYKYYRFYRNNKQEIDAVLDVEDENGS